MPYQSIGETCLPVPAAPGRRQRVDYEYVRRGTANLFLLVEPLRGWRHVDVTARRTNADFAQQMRDWSTCIARTPTRSASCSTT